LPKGGWVRGGKRLRVRRGGGSGHGMRYRGEKRFV
jgi:hypothetical protein